jgi:hypothetical protein
MADETAIVLESLAHELDEALTRLRLQLAVAELAVESFDPDDVMPALLVDAAEAREEDEKATSSVPLVPHERVRRWAEAGLPAFEDYMAALVAGRTLPDVEGLDAASDVERAARRIRDAVAAAAGGDGGGAGDDAVFVVIPRGTHLCSSACDDEHEASGPGATRHTLSGTLTPGVRSQGHEAVPPLASCLCGDVHVVPTALIDPSCPRAREVIADSTGPVGDDTAPLCGSAVALSDMHSIL